MKSVHTSRGVCVGRSAHTEMTGCPAVKFANNLDHQVFGGFKC